ncbi:MAG: hypothetical protein ACLSUM_00770 [Dysosmobacter welbionis]
MANYTQHYHLHQWEPEDSFLRTDFNGDFQRLDEALAGLDGRKPELRLGRYTGDGTQNRAVALGCPGRSCSSAGIGGPAGLAGRALCLRL